MPRNNDGTVSRARNYELDDANNAEFNGKILNDDFEDMRKVSEETLDVKGRNAIQANTSWGGNKITNLQEGSNQLDAINLSQVLKLIQGGITFIDNGSEASSGTIKLKTAIEDLATLSQGDRFSFIAPFSITKEQIVANGRYETFEIALQGATLEAPVLRMPYQEDASFVGGIKDPRASFIAGNKYTIELIEKDIGQGLKQYFRIVDSNLEGQQITLGVDSYTPAGYVDLAYDYAGYVAMSKYNYLGGYSPKRKSTDINNANYEVYERAIGAKIGVMPQHQHSLYGQQWYEETGGDSLGLTSGGSGKITSNVIGINTNYIELGDKVEPLSNIIRYLQKL